MYVVSVIGGLQYVGEPCQSHYPSPGHGARRFTFELSPGQVPLKIKSPFTLVPCEGIFVRPVLREHLRAEE